MKVGKEGIAAAIVALLAFAAGDRAAKRTALRVPLLHWQKEIANIAAVRGDLDPDPAGNPFDRLRITVLPRSGFVPWTLSTHWKPERRRSGFAPTSWTMAPS